MQDPYLNSVLELLASMADTDGPHLITVDELRAAGALDVPAAWRKSLGGERDPAPRLFEDDDPPPEQQRPTPREPDCDGSADGT